MAGLPTVGSSVTSLLQMACCSAFTALEDLPGSAERRGERSARLVIGVNAAWSDWFLGGRSSRVNTHAEISR